MGKKHVTETEGKILTTIPFSGFYESLHDGNLDSGLEMIFSDESGHEFRGSNILERANDAVNWGAVHEAYAKGYAEAFAHHIGINGLEFDELNSPREYNFTTDRIFVYIPKDEIAQIHRETMEDTNRKAILEKLIKDKFTSRSGFMSFYDNDLTDWPADVSEWDHNQVGTLIEACAETWATDEGHDGFDIFAEHSLIEDDMSNGWIDECLFTDASREFSRLASIASYLREREMREYYKRTRKSA